MRTLPNHSSHWAMSRKAVSVYVLATKHGSWIILAAVTTLGRLSQNQRTHHATIEVLYSAIIMHSRGQIFLQ
jgi:hypothetical protein